LSPKKRQSEPENDMAEAMNRLFDHVQKISGGLACTVSDLEDKSWGIPSDHISYRWLTDNVCFPMGRIIGIAGVKESCKSAYAATIVKQFMDMTPYSFSYYLDTEKKIAHKLYKTILETDYGNRAVLRTTDSTEDWQGQALQLLEPTAEDSSYDQIPLIVVVDSLGGVDTIETSNRIEKEGMANPRNTGGMIKCKSHNEFFRHITKYLYMKPYTFIYINHLSDDPSSPIPGSKRKPGGTGQDYHAVIDFWFSVVKGTPQEKANRGFTEKLLKITTAKNSIGASKRNIEIPYRWSKDEIGEMKRVWFDWDAATAMLLSEDGAGSLKPKLRHILNVTCNSNKYSCKELGLVAVTDTEMGEAIKNNVEMRERISDALGINRMKVFELMNVDKEIYETRKYSIANLNASEPAVQ
jgi:hypothetical protein